MKFFSKFAFYVANILLAVVIVVAVSSFMLNYLDNYTNHGETIEVPAFYRMSKNEFAAAAKGKQLQITIIDSLYNKNELPGVVLEQYPAPGAKVKANRMIQVVVNMQSPEKITFPNLLNSAYRQSTQTIEALGLRVGRISYKPSEFKNLVLGFTVAGMPIAPNDKIAKGTVVDIVLGDGNSSNRVAMPRVVGLNYRKAATLIRQSFLNTDSIFMDETVDLTQDYGNCWVYMQNPRPDSLIPAGTGIKLYLTNSKELTMRQDSLNIDNLEIDNI
ncbi:MAG: PASTA domain-containing protein [Marinifilaceae bacterium]